MKVAVYFGSIHIYKDMIPAYKSLLVNSDVDKIYLLTEDDKFPYELHRDVENINIARKIETWFERDGANWNSAWKYVGLIRCALSKVFPDLDTILSIDCDTIVKEDVSDLWNINLNNFYVAGVMEPHMTFSTHSLYVNAGVTMWNLKKIREDGIDDKMIDDLNRNRRMFVCQDTLNAFCRDRIFQLPAMYNVSDFTEQSKRVKIFHYAGGRPKDWRKLPIVEYYRNLPLDEIRPESA